MPLKIWFRGGGGLQKTYAGEGLMFKRECLRKEGPGKKRMAKNRLGPVSLIEAMRYSVRY